jgi:carbon monoxide dehydrogenase subunit G
VRADAVCVLANQEGELAAEMRFEHEFTVEVPLDQAWRALADADALAASFPDARLRAVDGVHTGRIELDASRKLSCEATITGVDQDDDEHVATVSVHGRQVAGPAIGSAVLRSRLSDEGSGTKVNLTADVLTTGHEPGNGFEAEARRVFEAVAGGLERRAREGPPAAVPAAQAAHVPAPAAAPESVPVPAQGSWRVRASADKRLAGGAAGIVIAAFALRRVRRRRRRRF